MVYTFTNLDCASPSHFSYTTLFRSIPDFSLPADGSSTVNCPANAVLPTAPAVTDACGNTITPTVVAPSPITCNGTMVYTFTKFDCQTYDHQSISTYMFSLLDFTLPA